MVDVFVKSSTVNIHGAAEPLLEYSVSLDQKSSLSIDYQVTDLRDISGMF